MQQFKTHRSRGPHKRLRAFTAIEALIAAAILAILTAAVSGALMAGRQQARTAQDTLYASLLARALMDEVTRLPLDGTFSSFGHSYSETSRGLYNDADDYYNYTDGPNDIQDIAGNLLDAEFQPFKRAVTFSVVTYNPTGWSKSVTALLVTVNVTRDGRPLVTLQRLVCE